MEREEIRISVLGIRKFPLNRKNLLKSRYALGPGNSVGSVEKTKNLVCNFAEFCYFNFPAFEGRMLCSANLCPM